MDAKTEYAAAKGKNLVIVTTVGGTNYGAQLQSFALQTTLESYGYNAGILGHLPNPNGGKLKRAVRTALLYFKVLQLKYAISSALSLRGATARQKKCASFRKENYKFKHAYTKRELDNLIEETDVFISGSDQVWNPYVFGTPPLFLDFAQDKKRISYASSIGVSAIPDEHKSLMRDSLMKYQHISVREETAVKVLQELTGRRDIVQALDPTFLLTKDGWLKVAEGVSLGFEPPKRFILAYLLAPNPLYNEQMKDIAAKAEIKDVILVRSEEAERDDFCIEGAHVCRDAGPKEFLHLLDACSLVVTDSFHGMALSINFKKPFVAFKRFKDQDPKSENSRVYDLLGHFGLMGQLYAKDSAKWLNLFNEANDVDVARGGGIHKSRSPFGCRQGALSSVFDRRDRRMIEGLELSA